jgi:hypothetical protein
MVTNLLDLVLDFWKGSPGSGDGGGDDGSDCHEDG